MAINKYFKIINCPAYTPYGGLCMKYKDRCMYRKRCDVKLALKDKKDMNNFFEVREIEIEEE